MRSSVKKNSQLTHTLEISTDHYHQIKGKEDRWHLEIESETAGEAQSHDARNQRHWVAKHGSCPPDEN